MEKLGEIFSLGKEEQAFNEKKRSLLEPKLSDLNLIPKVFDLFKDVLLEMDCPPRIDSARTKKKFIFVVLVLFFPSKLAGYHLDGSIRSFI
jgi:hypothetical protein